MVLPMVEIQPDVLLIENTVLPDYGFHSSKYCMKELHATSPSGLVMSWSTSLNLNGLAGTRQSGLVATISTDLWDTFTVKHYETI